MSPPVTVMGRNTDEAGRHGLRPIGVFSRAFTCQAGWARSKRGKHRFDANRLLPLS
jgi:hypothetical protein